MRATPSKPRSLALTALALLSTIALAQSEQRPHMSYEQFKQDQRTRGKVPDYAMLSGIEAVQALHGEDWELRWTAADSLGAAGNHEATEALINALTNEEDWRLSFTAAVALGRLHEQRAVPALTQLAFDHWYPPVRSAARKAIAVITGKTSYANNALSLTRYLRFGMMDTDLLDPEIPVEVHVELTAPSRMKTTSGPEELSPDDLQDSAYHTPINSRVEGSHDMQIGQVFPRCGLKMTDGLFLGADRGEWGGELVFVDSRQIVQILATENTIGIHRLPCGIVAVTGCGHMGNRDAFLYLVTHSKQNGWSAHKWRALPAAPRSSGFLPDGRLYIACDDRLDVILSTDGKLTMAESAPSR